MTMSLLQPFLYLHGCVNDISVRIYFDIYMI